MDRHGLLQHSARRTGIVMSGSERPPPHQTHYQFRSIRSAASAMSRHALEASLFASSLANFSALAKDRNRFDALFFNDLASGRIDEFLVVAHAGPTGGESRSSGWGQWPAKTRSSHRGLGARHNP
ncbi:MAG TPA: hypothetical protein VFR68_14520 [Candidatus Dormibacteraeota bacterium]|nr:hypothetical protein [Candidatus Dormibacteraeota bacterium]